MPKSSCEATDLIQTLVRPRNASCWPVFVLGTMNFGRRTNEKESLRILERARESGIVHFDTANAYSDGASEAILGKALSGERKSVCISTKVGFARKGGRPEGLSRAAIAQALEESLSRLRTDYVDLYYLHVPDHETPIEETLSAIADALSLGKILEWGTSNYSAWQILELSLLADKYSMKRPRNAQQLYNLLIRELDIEYFAFAKRYGVHTTVYNPLAGGLLTGRFGSQADIADSARFKGNTMYKGRYWSKRMFDLVESLRPVSERAGMSMTELSYSFLFSAPGVDSILVGPGEVAHLEEALAVARGIDVQTNESILQISREFSGTDAHYVR